MKEPTFAPAYVGLYPALAEVAREHGYALAVHGTVTRDFDLIAIPWTEEATDAKTLITALAKRIEFALDKPFEIEDLFTKKEFHEDKPHGRKAWSIILDCGASLDISVTPRNNNG